MLAFIGAIMSRRSMYHLPHIRRLIDTREAALAHSQFLQEAVAKINSYADHDKKCKAKALGASAEICDCGLSNFRKRLKTAGIRIDA
jgi:hypothetical protein